MKHRYFQSPSVQTVAVVASYVPRLCGIATFAKDLRDAVATQFGQPQAGVVAVNDNAAGYAYPEEVRFQIPQHEPAKYASTADLLNVDQIDCVLLQHEYGIFGGEDGSFILDFARALRMPLITTLHTVLREPTSGQKAVIKELARLSDRLVVMSHLAQKMLREIYGVPAERIAYIPHGIPDVPFVDSESFKEQFGVEGRRVLLTFGLLSPGKGIEVAIKAMPAIVARHPDALYIILGATHPHVIKNEGNAYRSSLERLVDRLGLDKHVVFHNRYVTLQELLGYLGVAEIYVTPYANPQQVTSGTLAYAVGAGKAVVSTPYWHAEEMLADGRGRIFPFGDSASLAGHVIDLLNHRAVLNEMRQKAYAHGRPMIWQEVAHSYLLSANEAIRERSRKTRPIVAARAEATKAAAIPEVSTHHLRRLRGVEEASKAAPVAAGGNGRNIHSGTTAGIADQVPYDGRVVRAPPTGREVYGERESNLQ